MEKLIACCGIDCAKCDARTATVNDDNELRKSTAEKWKAAFNAPSIKPDMINCTGCREDGVKFSHCEECEIRKCVSNKGFSTCGECSEVKSCALVAPVHQYDPETLNNLLTLN